MRTISFLLIVISLALFGRAYTQADDDRRARREPGLILETGGRTGACDVLQFTRDGNTLLAVGDDKVVRSWTVKPNELIPLEPLRWSIWRQMRGVIYTMALSPDESKVAVAGCGVRNGSVSVIDRTTGKVLNGLLQDGDRTVSETVWALAFSPSGKFVAVGDAKGSVWIWEWERRPTTLRELGTHRSCVRYFRFNGDETLISIASDGPAIEWEIAGAKRREFKLFAKENRDQIIGSRDGQWIAAYTHSKDQPFEVVASDGSQRQSPRLAMNEMGQAVALTNDGSAVAVACRTVPANGPFVRETSARVVVFDRNPRGQFDQRCDIPIPHIAERVAWHPDGKRLAVAGGIDHEVTLWDLSGKKPERITSAVGVGKCLWGIGFSKDGKSFGWQDRPLFAPEHQNKRGSGPWKVFDLEKRVVIPGDKFQRVHPIDEQAGWTVRPHPANPYLWAIVSPSGKSFDLPLDWRIDDRPRCHTFLPPVAGRAPWLAVGHYWGISVFELLPEGPKRLWLGHGHQGYVSALAPSTDGRLLIAASRDQTISCWATDVGENAFGAEYRTGLGQIYVDKVRAGSPAWEAGLARGDEVFVFAYGGGEYVFDPERKSPAVTKSSDTEACLKILKNAVPNKQLEFWIRRAGKEQKVTSAFRQRPLWCFFPTRSQDWVLWRFFDYIYDCSPGGDAFIGWQIGADADETPTFYPARGFSQTDQFYQPNKISQMLSEGRYEPDKVRLPDLEPPELTVRLASERPEGVALELKAEPRGQRDVFQVESAMLWVNDFRFLKWEKPSTGRLNETVVIPSNELRPGLNRLSWHVTSRAGTTERRQILVDRRKVAGTPKRFALLAGVADYRSTRPRPGESKPPWHNLGGIRIDLVRVESMLQRNGYEVTTLEDGRASPEAVQKALKSFESKLGPNDVFMLYLAGHGWAEESGGKSGTYVFVGPNFDFSNPARTGLPTDVLYDHLARIRGRKIVLLMTCHAGDATVGSLRDPVRELTPGGVGPLVIAACAARESALVDPQAGSLFALALRSAFAGRSKLSAEELADAIKSGVPKILTEWKEADQAEPDPMKRRLPLELQNTTQTPCVFAPDPEVGRTIVIGK